MYKTVNSDPLKETVESQKVKVAEIQSGGIIELLEPYLDSPIAKFIVRQAFIIVRSDSINEELSGLMKMASN
jgi:hypothetical protein